MLRLHFALILIASLFAIHPRETIAQTSSSPKDALTDQNVSQAISNWASGSADRVTIDREAKHDIAASIAGQKNSKAEHIVAATAEHQDQRVNVLVGSYLSEVRDRKYRTTGQDPGTKINLDESDFHALPFDSYLHDITGQAAMRNPGLLSVASTPPGARIKIDDAVKGMTNSDFVVSKGYHSIVVKSEKLNCSDNIDIEDDPVTYKCPKRVRKLNR